MTKLASPLSTSASASHVSLLPWTRTFVGAGGGVVSVTLVSLTYSTQAFATSWFGSHAALSGSPVNFAAGAASPPRTGASHAPSAGTGRSGSPTALGRRAPSVASSQGTARYRWFPQS